MKKLLLPVLLLLFPFFSQGQCYCTPAWYYPSACGGTINYMLVSASQHLLLNGASGAINDSVACDTAGYLDRTGNFGCTLHSGSSYVITVGCTSGYPLSYQVWIDFNSNGVFDSTESVGGDSAYAGSPVRHINIAIPTGLGYGTRRLRIESEYYYHVYPYLNPCPDGTAASSYYYGEVRDYSVVIDSTPTYLTASPATLSFSPTSAGTTSTAMVSVLNGGYLTPASGTLTVAASPNFSVCSTAGGTYTSSYTISYSSATVSSVSIYTKFNAPSTAGYYTGNVCITGCALAAGACIATSGSSVISLGTSSSFVESSFTVFPNPADDELILKMDAYSGGDILIFNSIGTQAMRQPISAGETRLNVKSLPAGNYYVRLMGAGSSEVKQFVKL